jgi:hypothetical protein
MGSIKSEHVGVASSMGAINACMRLPGCSHLANVCDREMRCGAISKLVDAWQYQQTGPADGSNGVGYLQAEIATSGSTTMTLLHFCCSYRRPFQTSTESLPIPPDCNRVAFSLSSNEPTSLLPAHGKLGCWMTRPHGSRHELPPAMSDMFQSYCNTCISKCCLLVGRDNRSKQALPARSLSIR